MKGKGRFRLGPGGGAGDPSLPRERMQGGLEKGDDIHRIYPYISRYCPRPRITGDKVWNSVPPKMGQRADEEQPTMTW